MEKIAIFDGRFPHLRKSNFIERCKKFSDGTVFTQNNSFFLLAITRMVSQLAPFQWIWFDTLTVRGGYPSLQVLSISHQTFKRKSSLILPKFRADFKNRPPSGDRPQERSLTGPKSVAEEEKEA